MASKNKMIILGIVSVISGILSIVFSIRTLRQLNNGEIESNEENLEMIRFRSHWMWFMGINVIIGGLYLIFSE